MKRFVIAITAAGLFVFTGGDAQAATASSQAVAIQVAANSVTARGHRSRHVHRGHSTVYRQRSHYGHRAYYGGHYSHYPRYYDYGSPYYGYRSYPYRQGGFSYYGRGFGIGIGW